jgi:hypothetical protein
MLKIQLYTTRGLIKRHLLKTYYRNEYMDKYSFNVIIISHTMCITPIIRT